MMENMNEANTETPCAQHSQRPRLGMGKSPPGFGLNLVWVPHPSLPFHFELRKRLRLVHLSHRSHFISALGIVLFSLLTGRERGAEVWKETAGLTFPGCRWRAVKYVLTSELADVAAPFGHWVSPSPALSYLPSVRFHFLTAASLPPARQLQKIPDSLLRLASGILETKINLTL